MPIQVIKVKPYLLWWAVGLAVADWMFETILHTYMIGEGTFAENFFPHDANELWMRLLIIVLIIGFGYVADIFLTRQKQMAEHTARLNRLLRFLSEVNQNVQRRDQPQDMFEGICNAAVELGGFRFAWVGLQDEETSSLKPAAHTAFNKPCLKAVEKAGIGPTIPCAMALQAISEGEPAHCMVLQDTSCEAAWREPLLQHGCQSAAAFPIQVQGKPFGVLSVYAGDSGFFHDKEIAILDEAADDVSFALTAIENEKQKKQAKTQLEESEAFKASIVASALDGIVSMNSEGRIVEFNPAAEAMFGYRRSEVVGEELADKMIPDELHEKHTEGLKRYLETGESHVVGTCIEITAMHADGHTFPVELCISRVQEAEPPAFTSIIRDITERKKAEEELRSRIEELERFQKVTVQREFRIKELRDELTRLKAGKDK